MFTFTTKTIKPKLVFIIFTAVSNLTNASEYLFTIGVVLGNTALSASSLDQQKLCIIEFMTIDLHREYNQFQFAFANNRQSIFGTEKAVHQLLEQDIDLLILPFAFSHVIAAKNILDKQKIRCISNGTLNALMTVPAMSLSTIQKVTVLSVVNISYSYSVSMRNEFNPLFYPVKTNQRILNDEFVNFNADKAVSTTSNVKFILMPFYKPNIVFIYTFANKNKITIISSDYLGARPDLLNIRKENNRTIIDIIRWLL